MPTRNAQAIHNSLSGSLTHFSALFLEPTAFRHHRYELNARQVTKFSRRFHWVIEGRLRADLAYQWSPANSYAASVKRDEEVEFQVRQAYLDFLGSQLGFRLGWQQIQWVETLSIFANDFLTPLDLRYGGFGSLKSIIEPQFSFSLNHPFPGGSLEWMIVPLPRTTRLPAGENGYGYYDLVARLFQPQAATLFIESIPMRLEESEAGVRYLANFGGLDLTLLGFYGHQKLPALTADLAATASVRQSYPRVATFGTFLAYSADAWVGRALLLLEPRRGITAPSLSLATASGAADVWDRRIRVGLGFDYVFSNDLKVYSEILRTDLLTYATSAAGAATAQIGAYSDFIATLRLTNESFRDIVFELTATASLPKVSYLLSPAVVVTLGRHSKFTLGAHLVHSDALQSLFEPIRSASQAYFLFEYFFRAF